MRRRASANLYFYDTQGNPIAAESVVDVTGDLEVQEDGGLTVQTEMEPLGVLTIPTHGQGEVVTGSTFIDGSGLFCALLCFVLRPNHLGCIVDEFFYMPLFYDNAQPNMLFHYSAKLFSHHRAGKNTQ